jgi:hypothetical protein
MHARISHNIQRLRARPGAPRRRVRRTDRVSPPPAELVVEPSEPVDPEARVREAGGPEDRACYTCSCGLVFQAPVSTSVECPHCGTDQAW